MAWNDNLLDAKYTSPSGKQFLFLTGDVSKETDLKTATFTFAEKDGALIQSLGRGGRRFPLTCTFWGANCIKEANAFEKGLEETGIGSLQHPVYGTRKVVPTGSIKRTDNIVSGSNISTVEVTFAETLVSGESQNEDISDDELNEDFSNIQDSACEDFANSIFISNASEQIKIENAMKDSIISNAANVESMVEAVHGKHI